MFVFPLAKPQQNAVKERVNLKKIISEVTALLETQANLKGIDKHLFQLILITVNIHAVMFIIRFDKNPFKICLRN
jgi:hypothetical protein